MTKKRWLLVAAIGAALVLAGLLGWLLGTHIWISGKLYPKNLEIVDFSKITVDRPERLTAFDGPRELRLEGTALTAGELAQVRKAYPEAKLSYTLKLEGLSVAQDAKALTVPAFSAQDAEALAWLPELEIVDGTQCADTEALVALASARPDLEVRFYISIGQERYLSTEREILVSQGNREELTEKLSQFRALEKATLTGALPAPEDLRALESAYPKTAFDWHYSVGALTLDRSVRDLDLTEASVTLEELEKIMAYYPGLATVTLGDDLPQEGDRGLAALAEAWPNTHFLWNVTSFARSFNTGDPVIDLSGTVKSPEEIRWLLPALKQGQKLLVCDQELDNEAMDALNQNCEAQVVWTVTLRGNVRIRTDETTFMPWKFRTTMDDEDLVNLKYCRDMVCIDLGHGHATHCAWAANMPHLKYLILADNPVTDISGLENCKELIYLELFLTNVTDLSPLTSCTALEDLNICYDPVEDVTPLLQMTWLKRLWWSGIGNWEWRQQLQEHLPETEFLFSGISSTGGGWRKGQNYYDMRKLLGMWAMIED